MTTIYDTEIQVRPTSQKSNVIAQAEVLFHGDLRVKGIRVLKSQLLHPRFHERITVQPPAYRNGFRWVEIFYVENKNLWIEIEAEIYKQFKALNINYEPLDEVSVDDIPNDFNTHLPP